MFFAGGDNSTTLVDRGPTWNYDDIHHGRFLEEDNLYLPTEDERIADGTSNTVDVFQVSEGPWSPSFSTTEVTVSYVGEEEPYYIGESGFRIEMEDDVDLGAACMRGIRNDETRLISLAKKRRMLGGSVSPFRFKTHTGI